MKNSITLVSNILVKYIGYLHLITYFFTSFNKIKLTFLTSKESQYAVIHVTFTPTLFKPLQATDPTKKTLPSLASPYNVLAVVLVCKQTTLLDS